MALALAALHLQNNTAICPVIAIIMPPALKAERERNSTG